MGEAEEGNGMRTRGWGKGEDRSRRAHLEGFEKGKGVRRKKRGRCSYRERRRRGME